MKRLLAGGIVAAAFALAVGGAATAQGDQDCGDFATPAEAQAYFEAGGGSASFNFNNLDADRDGAACEDFAYAAPAAPAAEPTAGPVPAAPAEPEAAIAGESPAMGDQGNVALALPRTGTGAATDRGPAVATLLVGALALVALAAATAGRILVVRRELA